MDEDPSYDIGICTASDQIAIEDARLRDAIARTLQRGDCRSACISVALVDDCEIARLNKRFLNHDGPTDVLSFDLTTADQDGVDGEIIISVETALREAAAHGHDTLAEVLLYAVHGTLHLLGMDDSTFEQAAAMHAMEDEVLIDLGCGPVFGRETA